MAVRLRSSRRVRVVEAALLSGTLRDVGAALGLIAAALLRTTQLQKSFQGRLVMVSVLLLLSPLMAVVTFCWVCGLVVFELVEEGAVLSKLAVMVSVLLSPLLL